MYRNCTYAFYKISLFVRKTFPIPGGFVVNIDDVFRRCGATNPGRCAEVTRSFINVL